MKDKILKIIGNLLLILGGFYLIFSPSNTFSSIVYKTSFFSENLQNGVVYVKNTQRTWSGIFQNIRIFPERNAVETGLPIQYVVVEGDY